MRISTNMIYTAGVARMSDLQSSLQKTQQQISTGKRVLTPSDDPIAAARALDLGQGKAVNLQYGTNRANAKNSLSLEESVLTGLTSLIQDIQTQTVEAGNGAYDDTQRKYIATDLRSQFDELMGLANTRDAEGNYLFSGFKSATAAFTSSSLNVKYDGDQGQRMLQVGPTRQMAISDTGDAIFQNIKSTGLFDTASTSGALTVSPLSTVDASVATGHNYNVVFSSGSAYSVQDVTNSPATTVASGTYTSGTPIVFDGVQLTITGTAASGDAATVRPSTEQSLFTTLGNLINSLETPATGAAGKANLSKGLADASANLANALDNVLTVRSSIGSRLKEIDSLDSSGTDRDIQYESSISDLINVDSLKAISDFNMQQITLEAAQKTFTATSKLSLFNFL